MGITTKIRENLNQRKFINTLCIIALLILSFSILSAYQQINKSIQSNSWVIHTYNVIDHANQLNTDLIDMESRASIYVISKETELIKNINMLKSDVYLHLNSLKDLTHDNSTQQRNLQKLESLIEEKLNLMFSIIGANLDNKYSDFQLAGSKKRIQLKEEIDKIIKDFNREELRLLNIRSNAFEISINEVFQKLIFSMLLAGFIFIFCFVLLNYYLDKQKKYEQKISAINNKLKESEERYLLATDGSSLGLWDWKPGTDNVYFSPYFKKLLGFENNELPNSLKSFERCLHPDDHAQLWEAVNLHLEKKIPYKVEYRLRNKEGEYRWFQASGQALWDENNQPIRMLGSITDITDKKTADERLHIQHEVIRILSSETITDEALLKTIQSIHKVLPWDIAAVWLANEDQAALKCVKFWQYKEEILNDIFKTASQQLTLPFDVGIQGKVYSSKQVLFISDLISNDIFTRRLEAKQIGLNSGIFIPIFVKNSVFGVLEFFTYKPLNMDESFISMFYYFGFLIGEYIERTNALKELRNSEIYKTAILDSALEGIITIDHKKNILSCNRQTNKIFDYENDSLISKNIEILLPNFHSVFSKLVDQGFLEAIGRRKNNEYFPAELVMSKMDFQDQQTYVLIIRDISERKKIEKMKNEFISLVSHELRTPLTSIQGSVDLILDGTVGSINQDVKELLDIAKKNGERLIRLINDILDLEKIEAGKMEFKLHITDINSIVTEAIKLNQAFAAKNGVLIQCIKKSPTMYVNIDYDRLMQVLTNLLSNAIKYTPEGKEVDVSIIRKGLQVRVIVTDKGPGIAEEFKSRIFQKFAQEDSTLSRSKGGTGLGLSISKTIIERMHGEINYTTSDKGSSFYFDLPMAIPLSDPSAYIQELDRSVLICDHDVKTTSFVQAYLQKNNFKTFVVEDIQKITDVLNSRKIDALFIHLFEINQDEVPFLNALKENYGNLPIVVIADTNKENDSGLYASYPIIDWIIKPVNHEHLNHAVQLVNEHIKKHNYNILFIENDTDISQIVQKTLRYEGDIYNVNSRLAAIDALSKHHYDLVILDLMLPDGSGTELISRFYNKKIPIIVYSAYELPESYLPYVEEVLTKSITSNSKILSSVRKILNRNKLGFTM